MFTYLTFFFYIILLTWQAEKCIKKNDLLLGHLLLAVSILSLSIFASLRNLRVGTDINVYLRDHFIVAGRYTFIDYLTKYKPSREVLYKISVWSIRQISDDIHFYLFFHQLFIAIIVYHYGIKECVSKNESFVMYIVTYLMIWYATTFNIIKQTVAITLLIPAFFYLREKNYRRFIVTVYIASFFHTSVLIAVVFPLLQYLANKSYSTLYTLLLGLISILVLYYFENLFSLVSRFEMFDRYSSYFDKGDPNFHLGYFCVKLSIATVIIFFSTVGRGKEDLDERTLVNIMLMDIAGYAVSAVVKYGYRVSYPFLLFQLFLIPLVDKKMSKKRNQIMFRVVICLLLLLYFYWRYVRIGYDGIIPYLFYFQDSL